MQNKQNSSKCTIESHEEMKLDWDRWHDETEFFRIVRFDLPDGVDVQEWRHCKKCKSTLAIRLAELELHDTQEDQEEQHA